jgi:hypothetical protein
MLSLIDAKLGLGRRKGILCQLGANIPNEIGLGADRSNPKKNSRENEPPLPYLTTHRLMMKEALKSCK